MLINVFFVRKSSRTTLVDNPPNSLVALPGHRGVAGNARIPGVVGIAGVSGFARIGAAVRVAGVAGVVGVDLFFCIRSSNNYQIKTSLDVRGKKH